MRTIRDTPDLSPVYLVKWEHWTQVLKDKLKGLTGNIKQYNEKEQPVRPEAEYYPVTWRKGAQVVHEVQAQYYQHEDEEGNKGTGYCETFIFWNSATPPSIARKIAEGTHPVKLGFTLDKYDPLN